VGHRSFYLGFGMIIAIVLFLVCSLMSFSKGFTDAGYGTKYHTGEKDDDWHLWGRWGYYYPALSLPHIFGVLEVNVAYIAITGLCVAITSKGVFRYGVQRAGKSVDWYGRNWRPIDLLKFW